MQNFSYSTAEGRRVHVTHTLIRDFLSEPSYVIYFLLSNDLNIVVKRELSNGNGVDQLSSIPAFRRLTLTFNFAEPRVQVFEKTFRSKGSSLMSTASTVIVD